MRDARLSAASVCLSIVRGRGARSYEYSINTGGDAHTCENNEHRLPIDVASISTHSTCMDWRPFGRPLFVSSCAAVCKRMNFLLAQACVCLCVCGAGVVSGAGGRRSVRKASWECARGFCGLASPVKCARINNKHTMQTTRCRPDCAELCGPSPLCLHTGQPHRSLGK